ncbi:J domain-containing protein [Cyanobacterium stanieri LEGE 03274]|uniref:J domain-containing protein n=1 Tax=Cyanobacterium stanieri LEGE 03274 TaxID=1828756 RepID=A0ABR9V2P9_9CHRO|nr:DnaJ domain-containing protein [Cyanobacterium stanieri]MBE9221829.1 J domain-containing protein [Cyanobacterium stanieri LEGE 03274]
MDYYQILEISSSATAQEVKRAYRRLVKKYHPDSHETTANHEEIIKINAAYEVLGDAKNRLNYDRTLANQQYNSLNYRQSKSESASQYYHAERRSHQAEDVSQFEWLKNVYAPLNLLVEKIIFSLEEELEELSGDPFDDDLMSIFCEYLDNCQDYYEKGKKILKSQPNPPRYAGVAANCYYCLNHISDGIEELQRFTMSYDYDCLHTAQELFRLALEVNEEARYMVNQTSY